MKIFGLTLATVLASALACPYMENGGEHSQEMNVKDVKDRRLNDTRELQVGRFTGAPEAAIADARQRILNMITNRPRLGVSIVTFCLSNQML